MREQEERVRNLLNKYFPNQYCHCSIPAGLHLIGRIVFAVEFALNLIEASKMTDEEIVKFIKDNRDKEFQTYMKGE